MTEAEHIAEERRARLMAELDEGCVSAGGFYVKLQKFPPPDVSGMTPEEEEAAVKTWIDAIAQWERETAAASGAEPPTKPAAVMSPTNASPNQAPVA